jgi:formate/nitrite transporter
MSYVKPDEALRKIIDGGVKKAKLPVINLLIAGMLSGAFLGVATTLALSASIQTGVGIVGALIFPIGFVLISLLGLELLTGNLAFLPLVLKDKRISILDLFYNWSFVLVGNLLGSILYAFLYYITITKMGNIDISDIVIAKKIILISEAKTLGNAMYGFDGTISVFTSAILCNWMVSLGAFMAFISTTTSGKILAMWLPIMTFFALGFEHAIVNMFVIPAGMMFGANVSMSDWWIYNQIPVLLGNLVGGMIFTGFALYIILKKRGE